MYANLETSPVFDRVNMLLAFVVDATVDGFAIHDLTVAFQMQELVLVSTVYEKLAVHIIMRDCEAFNGFIFDTVDEITRYASEDVMV